jgi:hypothetical protein
MREKFCYITRIIATIDLLSLVIITSIALFKGTNIDINFGFRFIICLSFSILLFQIGKSENIEIRDTCVKKKKSFYFLILCGVYLSILENIMFFEETIRERSSIACVIAAIAAYNLFKSAYKYIIKCNEEKENE